MIEQGNDRRADLAGVDTRFVFKYLGIAHRNARRAQAPNPATCTASCATSTWPVRAADASTASRSQGQIVRKSSTSTLMPSAASCSAASVQACTWRDQDTTVTSLPARATRALPKGTGSPVCTVPLEPQSSLCSM
ncbi:hypothetical protein J2T28_002572 [Kerstersia gyiorum]|nr:hypothetical protein [Kerstersia gyiorum]